MAYISPSNRKFLVAYLLLVGLPLLCLAGVLRAGRKLTAPTSVDGAWKFETDTARLASLPCGKSVAAFQDAVVNISQSGKSLILTRSDVTRTPSSGTIEDTQLTALIPWPEAASSETECRGDGTLQLVATIDASAKPKFMVATISIPGCSSCAALEFHGARQVHSAGKIH